MGLKSLSSAATASSISAGERLAFEHSLRIRSQLRGCRHAAEAQADADSRRLGLPGEDGHDRADILIPALRDLERGELKALRPGRDEDCCQHFVPGQLGLLVARRRSRPVVPRGCRLSKCRLRR